MSKKETETVVKEFWSPNQLARRINRDPATILSWIRSGELPASNLGKGKLPRWLITESDFQAFLKSKVTPPSSNKRRSRRRVSQTPNYLSE